MVDVPHILCCKFGVPAELANDVVEERVDDTEEEDVDKACCASLVSASCNMGIFWTDEDVLRINLVGMGLSDMISEKIVESYICCDDGEVDGITVKGSRTVAPVINQTTKYTSI